MSIAALIMRSKGRWREDWKQYKGPPIGECFNKLWCLIRLLKHSIDMDLGFCLFVSLLACLLAYFWFSLVFAKASGLHNLKPDEHFGLRHIVTQGYFDPIYCTFPPLCVCVWGDPGD